MEVNLKNGVSSLRVACVISMTLMFSGCASYTKVQTNTKIPQTYSSPDAKWSDQIIRTASETFLYAQLALNAYNCDDQTLDVPTGNYKLPPTVERVLCAKNDKYGMAYNLYKKTGGSKPEIIIAFRGSELNWLDWFTGNVRGKQLRGALTVFDDVKESYPNHIYSVTGDSLGGSLATQVSLCNKVNISVSLNTSPRFKAKLCKDNPIFEENNRHSIVQRGEILGVLRKFGREATQTYTSLPCSKGTSVSKHDVAKLSKCLTEIAQMNGDKAAIESIKENSEIWALENN